MLPDRVSNPGPLTYESGALPIALRGPARPYSKSLTGLKGHPRVILVIVTYRRGFVLVRREVCGTSGL